MDKKITFEELCKNKEFLQKVLVQKTEDDVKKIFAEKGVEVTQQDLNNIKETVQLILGKKQKLSVDEAKKVSGGMRTAAMIQLSAAVTEAALILLRSELEREADPTGTLRDIRIMQQTPGDPGNLSWRRVYANAINGTLDLDPRIRAAANTIVAWWNGE
ncbi:MAG: hypothetical protein RUMPE_00109 [Eubacteriales bacterium SKADARSKE-1]|nr:hypothetical protein [Eubacteriales bacterium SKADARSKE-1]